MDVEESGPRMPSSATNPWRKMVTRRQLLTSAGKGALAVGAAGALAGLVENASAAGASTRASSSKGITLDFGVEYTAPENQASVTKILIDPFLKSHPEVSAINYTIFNGGSALDHGLKLDFAAGTGPDIFDENGPSWMAPFANSHTALQLDEFYAQYNLTKRLYSWTTEPSIYKGHYYSVPAEYEGLHLWYNVDMFKKYGWKTPNNYNELVALGKEIQSKGLIVFASGFSDCLACWEWWYNLRPERPVGGQDPP